MKKIKSLRISLVTTRSNPLHLNRHTIVAKLAAILRLADALDDSGKQKIQKISVSLKKDSLVITASSSHNLALEKWAFNHKAKLFEEVFGIKPVLKQRRIGNNG